MRHSMQTRPHTHTMLVLKRKVILYTEILINSSSGQKFKFSRCFETQRKTGKIKKNYLTTYRKKVSATKLLPKAVIKKTAYLGILR